MLRRVYILCQKDRRLTLQTGRMNKNAHSFRYSSAARGFCSADRVGILKLLHEHNLEGWLVKYFASKCFQPEDCMVFHGEHVGHDSTLTGNIH